MGIFQQQIPVVLAILLCCYSFAVGMAAALWLALAAMDRKARAPKEWPDVGEDILSKINRRWDDR